MKQRYNERDPVDAVQKRLEKRAADKIEYLKIKGKSHKERLAIKLGREIEIG